MNEATLATGEVKMSTTGWQPYGPLGADEQLHFLHIPKTAGRSVRAVLEGHFDWDKICPGTVLPDLLGRSSQDLNNWRLYCGHYGRYIHRLLALPPVEITFLRDPIARSVSHYRDLKTREDTWLYEYVNTHSFDEFVLDPVTSTELLNLQTRYLALDHIDDDYFGYSRQRESDLPGLIAKYTSGELLERAMRNLDAMAFVGLQERFDESLALLAATFGWSPPREAPRQNTAKTPFDPSTISPRAMERLREVTALDQQVYDHAAERFAANMDSVTPERVEASYARCMGERPRVSELHLGFEKAFEGRGWYDRERGADGVVRRWTGPEPTAWIDLPLETSQPLRLRFKVGAQSLDVIQGSRVALNGVEIPADSWPLALPETPKRVFDLTLPAEALAASREFGRIEFRLPRTVTPANEFPGSDDRRSLGLYFEWLEVFPDRR
jgi:hypothetical protein